jgi:transcriptional regulator with XRE-family HTH domain
MQKTRTWRELLGELIKRPQERQRIAEALNVSPVTLNRWVQRETNPRLESLRRLLSVVPEHRQSLLELIEEEFPGFAPRQLEVEQQGASLSIPPEFYKRVLHTLTALPSSLRFASLCDLILQQALEQLDPQRLGMAIMVACCMPPVDGRIRSLRERTGRGTPPWRHDLEQQGILLGAESLAGHALSIAHYEVNQTLNEPSNRGPGYGAEWEESAVAVPILHLGKVAGSLLVSSTQPNYFSTTLVALVESYAELLALAFDPEDFYELDCVGLALLPTRNKQLPYLVTFARQVAEIMTQAMRKERPINISQAQLLVWQRIEQGLVSSNIKGDADQ